MAEEMKNQETMDDFAKEIDASFESFRDADMDIWEKLEKMKEDKTEFEVTIEGIVKGGATDAIGKFQLSVSIPNHAIKAKSLLLQVSYEFTIDKEGVILRPHILRSTHPEFG